MKLSYFPQLRVVHTSKIFHGQLFIPVANWLLMIGTILIASIFNNVSTSSLSILSHFKLTSQQTTSLGNAYGVCVMFVTFFDTCMVSLTAIFVWRYSPFLVFLPWLTIALMDGTFISSVLTKVPDGAWVTLMLAFILGMVFLLWRYGKEQQWEAEAEDRFPTSHLIISNPNHELQLTPKFQGLPLGVFRGFGIFFDKAGETTPTVFSQLTLKLTAIPEVMVFFHLRPLDIPSVEIEDRYSVSRLAVPNCYRLVVRYGYNDVVVNQDLGTTVYQQVRQFQLDDPGKRHYSNEKSTNEDNTVIKAETSDVITASESEDQLRNNSELAKLDAAFTHKVLYVLGKEQMKIKDKTNFFRKGLLWLFLWLRDNTRGKMANLNISADQLIEVGFLKEI